MFTFKKLFAVIAVMAISILVIPGNAVARTATAYPDCLQISISFSSDRTTVVGGSTATMTATAKSNVDPQPEGTLKIRALGKTHTFNGTSGTAKISTPVVSQRESHTVTASFTPDDKCTAEASDSVASPTQVTNASFVSGERVTQAAYTTPANAHATLVLALAGGDGDGDGILPNTGGTRFWYLVAGAALLGLGIAFVVAARSRRSKNLI